MSDLTSKAARELSSKGASKGGHARANTMTPEQRREIAKKAIAARWEKAGKIAATPAVDEEVSVVAAEELPYSMFQGKLKIGDIELECHVLNDHRRVFTQREIVRIISGGRESGNLRGYLDGNPLIDKGFYVGGNIPFRIAGQPTTAIGWEATGLVEICEKYLEAREQGLLKKNQFHLAIQAGIVVRSSAKVGIIALVDEATGYDKFKQKQEYQLKLQAFIADELQEWARMFPDEFWFELARLEKIHYSPRSRPLRWGKYVMMFVYDAVDGDIGKELRKKNPDPHFLQNHHQWLKQFGRDKVHDQITKVVTIMKLCENMEDFRKKFAKVFKKTAITTQLTFGWEIE
jgi:hypothetical protein